MSRTRVSIPFSQRGPIPIHLEDSYTGSPTGCSVIDVIFPQGEEISEVRFKSVNSPLWSSVLQFGQRWMTSTFTIFRGGLFLV